MLVRRPDDEDIERAALAAGFRAGWTERPMALDSPPSLGAVPADVEVRVVADAAAVVDYGRVVALANDDPGERERAPLLFHDETIIAPHIAAFVAYLEGEPVACAMTLVSHRVAGVFYVATVEHARRRGLGDALTRMAARTGFEMGAGRAWLGASEMGAGLYRRIGFEDLGSTLVELESPPSASALRAFPLPLRANGSSDRSCRGQRCCAGRSSTLGATRRLATATIRWRRFAAAAVGGAGGVGLGFGQCWWRCSATRTRMRRRWTP